MHLLRNAFVMLFSSVSLLSYGQQLRFDHFDITNQLSQNNITQLCIDDIGYVWVVTLEGLNRFDGYQTTKYYAKEASNEGYQGNQINALGKGSNGNLWVATNEGLNLYRSDLENFQFYPDSIFKPYEIKSIKHMVQTSSRNLWISNDTILACFDFINRQFQIANIGSSIESMIPISDSLLLVSGNRGVYKISLKGRDIISSSIFSDPVFQLTINSKGSVFGLNSDYIFQWTDLNHQPQFVVELSDMDLPEITHENLNAIVSKQDEIWIGGTYPLIKIDLQTKRAQKFEYNKNNPFSFKGYLVRNLALDANDNLWIGTSKHGLNLLDKRKNRFSYYNREKNDENQAIDPIRSISMTKSGDLWYGLDRFGVGLRKKNGDEKYYENFYDCDGKAQELKRVRSIFEDSRGNIWIGGLGGLTLYNKSNDRIESVDCHFDWSWPYHCYTIKEFAPDVLTITGKPNRIAMIDLKTKQISKFPNSNKDVNISGNIRDIIQDSFQNYWIGLNNGLLKIDKSTHNYQFINSQNSSLSNNKIYTLFADNDSIWIGTNSGLNIYSLNQGRIVNTIYENQGLVNNIVYSIHKDNQKRIWISTNKGISMFDTKAERFTNFLENDYFLDDAHFQDKNGELYFGGYGGIVSFKPSMISAPNNIPKPVIEEFYLFNKLLKPGDSIASQIVLAKSILQTQQIHLNYLQNTFSLNFNAFPFNYPNNNQFRYKLLGQHKDWIYAIRSNRLVSYSGLPPKEYEFHLQVSHGDGRWSNSSILKIDILPPFWQKTWFTYSMYFMLIILIYAVYRIRVNNIRRHNQILDKKVKEQTSKLLLQNKKILEHKNEIEAIAKKLHEADEAKLRFYTNISHEFRTPLTLILGQIEHLDSELSFQAIKSIKNNALRLLRLVEQFIDLRKLDHDQMKLSISKADIVAFTRRIVESFIYEAKKKGIDLEFKSNANWIPLWFDTDKMDKILYNLISNALKYTPENKKVFVNISRNQSDVIISVCDEGIGIDIGDLEKIFNRYYRSNKNYSEGHGLGLALVKSLVEIQHASIQVKSQKSEGTEFIMVFRLGNDHFRAEDIRAEKVEPLPYQISNSAPIIEDWTSSRFEQEILIVEDNEELNLFLKQVLGKYYKIQSAINGKEALEMIKNDLPELIISDVMMPELDGINFCKKLKENSITSNIPIILLTAKNDDKTKLSGFELGIDGFIDKPFSAELLLLRVQTILNNRASYRQFIIEHGDNRNEIKSIAKVDKLFWRRITSFIDENLNKTDLSVEDMSLELNMSRASFYRKFKNLSGVSPGTHLRKARLNRAKLLLVESTFSVSQICEKVGFKSISHFRRSFKNEFGETPTGMRNLYKTHDFEERTKTPK